jgi:hypothetical protein
MSGERIDGLVHALGFAAFMSGLVGMTIMTTLGIDDIYL